MILHTIITVIFWLSRTGVAHQSGIFTALFGYNTSSVRPVISASNVSDIICGIKCQNHEDCYGFNYVIGSSTCYLVSGITNVSEVITTNGSLYYGLIGIYNYTGLIKGCLDKLDLLILFIT